MSNDQKPGRIKIINGRAPARTGRNASVIPSTETETPAQPPKRTMPGGAILFLLGCAIGGAALAAWPHVIAG